MTLPFFFLLASFFALGPQAVFSFLNISFSNIEQCGRVNISFTGQDLRPQASQTRLTLLPFDSHPIPISIPTPLTNTTISFLPLSAGTQFIALLDDPSGDANSVASSVTSVLASSTNTTSCLPAVTDMSHRYSVENLDQLRQCQNFSVVYDGMEQAPTVRLVVSQGSSYILRPVATEPELLRATYRLNANYGREAVFLFSDESGHSETSGLFTVGGDNSSDDGCLSIEPMGQGFVDDPNQTMVGDAPSPPAPSGLSRESIIGIAAGGAGLVVLVVVLMLIYVIRDRRRRGRRDITYLEAPPHNWQSVQLPPTPPTAATFSAGFVVNPPYVSEKYSASMVSPRSTLSSWVNVSTISSTKGSFSSSLLSNQATVGSIPRITSSDGGSLGRSSISTVDIRQILDIAVMKEYAHNRSLSTSSIMPPARGSQLSFGRRASVVLPASPKMSSTPMLSVPEQDFITPRLNPRRARGFPDVPMDPISSVTLSALFPIPPKDIPTPPASPTVLRHPVAVEPLLESPKGDGEPSSPAPFTAMTGGVPTDCSADGSAVPVAVARPRPSNWASQSDGGNRDTTYSTGSIWYGVAQ